MFHLVFHVSQPSSSAATAEFMIVGNDVDDCRARAQAVLLRDGWTQVVLADAESFTGCEWEALLLDPVLFARAKTCGVAYRVMHIETSLALTDFAAA
jgi:hypothetical protein